MGMDTCETNKNLRLIEQFCQTQPKHVAVKLSTSCCYKSSYLQ